MSLEIIAGRKYSGKTTAVFNRLKRDPENSILIVPEQNIFYYEKIILENLGEELTYLIETLSFEKLAKKLLKDDGCLKALSILNRDTKNLILNKIIKERLSLFKGCAGKAEFANTLSEQITEFKKYAISPADLEEMMNFPDIPTVLQQKLADILNVYKAYEEAVADIFLDSDDMLTLALERAAKVKYFRGKTILFDSFTGFPKQELNLIRLMLIEGANVSVSLLLDTERENGFGDLFYTTMRTATALERIAKETSVDFFYTKCAQRGINSKGISHLEENLFLLCPPPYPKEDHFISVSVAKTAKMECGHIAKEIMGLISDGGLKFSDFAIIACDIDAYKKHITDSLSECHIPYYLNEKTAINDYPAAALFTDVLRLIAYPNNRELLLSYIKSGFFIKEDMNKIHRFEEFMLRCGVRVFDLLSGRGIDKIIREKRSFGFTITREDELNYVYNCAIVPLIKLMERVKGVKSACEIARGIYEFTEEIGLKETVISYGEDFKREGDFKNSSVYMQVYNHLMQSLERTALILRDEPMDIKRFYDVFALSLQNQIISTIPLLNDSVYITDIKSFFGNNFHTVFVVGAVEGSLPHAFGKESIINEEDRNYLKKYLVELSLSREVRAMEENLIIYRGLTSPKERLYISYPEFLFTGEELRPSMLMTKIADMFSEGRICHSKGRDIYTRRTLFEKTVDRLREGVESDTMNTFRYFYNDPQFGETSQKILKYLKGGIDDDIRIPKELLTKLSGQELHTTVTRLEQYRTCAFSYYMRYVLGLRERREFSPDMAHIGSLCHQVIELFSKAVKISGLSFSDITEEYIDTELAKITKKCLQAAGNGVFMQSKRAYYTINKIKRISKRTVNMLKEHFTRGVFSPIGFEMSFGPGDKDLKGISIQLDEGRTVHLSGVIDRVDSLADDNGDFIRVVDYKSSYKDISIDNIYYGLTLQLCVYLLTVLKQDKLKKLKPGGILYLTLDEPIVSIKGRETPKEIQALIRKRLIMKGLYLNDLSVITGMDMDLEVSKKSEIIDVSLDKSGIPKDKNTLSLKEFNELLANVEHTVANISSDIFSGSFPIRPVSKKKLTGCTYCPYGAVCCFDEKENGFVKLPELSKEDVFREAGVKNV